MTEKICPNRRIVKLRLRTELSMRCPTKAAKRKFPGVRPSSGAAKSDNWGVLEIFMSARAKPGTAVGAHLRSRTPGFIHFPCALHSCARGRAHSGEGYFARSRRKTLSCGG